MFIIIIIYINYLLSSTSSSPSFLLLFYYHYLLLLILLLGIEDHFWLPRMVRPGPVIAGGGPFMAGITGPAEDHLRQPKMVPDQFRVYRTIFAVTCSPNTLCIHGVFNPNIPIFVSNSAEGLHFSAFHYNYNVSI